MEDNKTAAIENEVNAEQKTDTATEQKAEDKQQDNAFTQEDVNNIVARESKKATEKLLKDLGIENFDNAKDGLAKFREWQEAQKTDQEKKDEAITNLTGQNETYKSENETLKAQIEALKLGVHSESIEDVILLAKKNVSEEVTIAEAIKGVMEKYPQFGENKEAKKEESKKPTIVNPKNNTGNDGAKEDVIDRLLKQHNYL